MATVEELRDKQIESLEVAAALVSVVGILLQIFSK